VRAARVGRYAAAATLSAPAVNGTSARVCRRYFGQLDAEQHETGDEELWNLVQRVLPADAPTGRRLNWPSSTWQPPCAPPEGRGARPVRCLPAARGRPRRATPLPARGRRDSGLRPQRERSCDQSVTNGGPRGISSRAPRPTGPGRLRRSDGVPVAEGGGFEPPRDVTPNTDSSRAP
jgi:hypothetical protein